jgi:hypothetical protein
LGDWKAESGEKMTFESWKEVSPKTFEGLGETRNRSTNELLNSETMRILEMSSEVFFLAKVNHNELPVAFKLTDGTNNKAIFENTGHDFPKKLEYHLISKNKMTVSVSDGKDKGFIIQFIRNDS